MKSKKIGTISLNINTLDFNYGAILHTWAFQKYLKKENLCEYTEVIDYKTPSIEDRCISNPLKWAIKNKKIKSIIKNLLIYVPYQNKYKKFENFKEQHLIISNEKYNITRLEKASLDYDTVICESDVIWSPGFFGGNFDPSFFMNLDSMKNCKKIAYSPSMANGDLTKEQEDSLIENLRDIDFISCRESYEKDILEKYTDKKITHVADPVFLLNSDDYDEITGDRIIKDKYILLYLPVDNNNKLRSAAKKYAREHKLKIIEIPTNCLYKFGNDKILLSAGVEEFLSAIKYAEVIFTNSFHAICFSMIFNKEFYAFSRKTAGKVKDICDVMNLEKRFFPTDKFEVLDKINYDDVNINIQKFQENSRNWLENALSK